YAKIAPTRGNASALHMSPELAEAEAILRRDVERESTPPLRHSQLSRVYVLRSEWEFALEEARTAYEADSIVGAPDLGLAYLARGIAQGRPRDLQWAVEYISDVLSRNATDRIGLFNRAIAFERLFLFHRAKDDCQAYLKVDGTSTWAEEVRQRLSRIE